ncbi:hypothetical protein KJY73_12575 [Bowmanella sp. Y26]|uniref:hypothetical protein n=1 Tax=Bowmanella yangjiangensis TaxID=2811230 RepID=UPI001BDBD76D|nr:hypothetical protein [Bowmanella yangjiangensis]MBT1064417.1 hypothetical protein [Bowmanella yangjiangensis]
MSRVKALADKTHGHSDEAAAFAALFSSFLALMTLLMRQWLAAVQLFKVRVEVATRSLFYAAVLYMLFCSLLVAMWITSCGMLATWAISQGVHWALAMSTVLIINAGVAWYLLRSARSLLKTALDPHAISEPSTHLKEHANDPVGRMVGR